MTECRWDRVSLAAIPKLGDPDPEDAMEPTSPSKAVIDPWMPWLMWALALVAGYLWVW